MKEHHHSPLGGSLEGLCPDAPRLDQWNQTTTSYPTCQLIHQLVEAIARESPHLPAVNDHVTYGELNRRANGLAHLLGGLNAGPETCVAVFMDHGTTAISYLLAVLKAGASYLPIAPHTPRDRVAFILEDADAPILLTHPDHLDLLPAYAGVILTPEEAFAPHLPQENPQGLARLENRVYTIYTSGSTGKPKGVEISHRNLLNLCWCLKETYHIGRESRASLLSNPAFDASVCEIWPYLAWGGSLHIPPQDARYSAPELMNWLTAQEITHMFAATPMAEELLKIPAPAHCALQFLLTGGDKLQTRPTPNFPALFTNNYGPTENTVLATMEPVGPGEDIPLIGSPLSNIQLYVMDRRFHSTRQLEPGELVIGGDSLARGYTKRPALTAEKFVPDPFSKTPGQRLYKSGDLTQWTSDGRLRFLGRIDFQVKIRGFRIELGEIENRLTRHPQVDAAVVLVREPNRGNKQLAAYLLTPDQQPVESDLESFLAETLPDYMIPTAFVFLDRFPLTANGKIDRRALPEPQWCRKDAGNCQDPETPVQKELAAIWREVLQLERVGLDQNFFKLGGHSLLATRVISTVAERLGVQLPIRTLFHKATIRELAEVCGQGRQDETTAIIPAPLDAYPQGYPLSFSQKRMWLTWKAQPQSPVYNTPHALKLTGPLNLEALNRALTALRAHHQALRTVFPSGENGPVQVVEDAQPLTPEVINLEGLSTPEVEATILDQAAKPFNLETGPLIAAHLYRLAPQSHVLLLSLHHMVTDGWSQGLQTRDLWTLYASGEDALLPDLPIQYTDYTCWNLKYMTGNVLQEHLAYWRHQLKDAPHLLELPTARPRGVDCGQHGAHVPMALSEDLSSAILELAEQTKTTPFMIFMTAYALLLGRHAQTRDLLVGSPIANRNHKGLSHLMGYFVNTLVFRVDQRNAQTFHDLLTRVKETTLTAYDHQDLPLDLLVEDLKPQRHEGANPLFQVMLVLQNTDQTLPSVPHLDLEVHPVNLNIAPMDLVFILEQGSHGFTGRAQYDTHLFQPWLVERMVAQFTALLQEICNNPRRALDHYAMMDRNEQALVTLDWNRTDTPFPTNRLTHQLVARVAQDHPDLEALEGLTYRRLNRLANSLARRLQSHGVKPETAVAVVMDHGWESLVSLLAVLKSGGCYTPMASDTPRDRLAHILKTSGSAVVVTHQRLLASLQDCGVAVITPRDEEEAGNPSPPLHLTNRAYMIFTSGSTGHPKGVAVTHENLLSMVHQHRRYYGIQPGARAALISNPAFDASVCEIWPYLASGARLHVPEPAVRYNPEQLWQWTANHQLTHLYAPTPMAEALLKEPAPADLNLQYMLTGGDRLQASPPPNFPARFVNHYGPTENTVVATAQIVESGQDAPPIGRAVDNVTLYVMSPQFKPQPLGVTGELVLGGRSVARGYEKQPGLTAQRFTPNPFATEPGSRLYRTGDLVRLTPDGAPMFLGRLDTQVKIRGFRIEPGEIENQLSQLPGVEGAVVLVRTHQKRKQLAAYVLCNENQPGTEALQQALSRVLPHYMVPSLYIFPHQFPLTANGKVDRKVLANMEIAAPALASPALAPERPPNPVESTLIQIWREVLELKEIGLQDNFYQLGGHSLLMAQIAARVVERLGVDAPLRLYFNQPVLHEQAHHLIQAMIEALTHEAARPMEITAGTQDERRLMMDWNRDHLAPPPPLGIHQFFEAQARKTPEATAILIDDRSLSYGWLNRLANVLASRLLDLGAGPETLTAVCLERNENLICALLAVLKTGSAYVPMDPNYPPSHIALLVEDAQAPILITDNASPDIHSPGTRVLNLSEPWDRGTPENPDVPISPEQAAYIIYTSGSTGKPKGVIISHGAAGALLDWAARYFPRPHLECVAAGTSVCFDLSIFELFLPLMVGGRILLLENILHLPQAPAARQATLVNTVPSAMETLLKTAALPSSVRAVNLAGEPFQPSLIVDIHKNSGVEQVHNLYGPSEDTTYSTGALMSADPKGPTPIGVPISHTSAYVTCNQLNLKPMDEPGELLLGGRGLARGYWNKPATTAEKFIPNPYASEPGSRLYKTGDLVKIGQEKGSSTLIFLGRLDHQVKLRGFRIELGEIEARLHQCEGVEKALVCISGDQNPLLTAYVTPAEPVANREAWSDAILSLLKEQLPGHMVPQTMVVLDAFPTTPNGKIDRKALPQPGLVSQGEHRALTPEEHALTQIWGDLLGTDRIDPDQNLFKLGAHSLMATRAASRIRDRFQVDVNLRFIFQNPTIAGQARWLTEHGSLIPMDETTPGSSPGQPASFAQKRLWLIDQLNPGNPVYNMPATYELRGPLNTATFQQAISLLVERHSALRTLFPSQDGEPIQKISDAITPQISLISLRGLENREEEAKTLMEREGRIPFYLETGPLFRFTLLELAEDRRWFRVNLHHIVGDGWSLNLLITELCECYRALLIQVQPKLQTLETGYIQYAVHQHEWLKTPQYEKQKDWWRRQLEDAPVLELPLDRPRPKQQTFEGDTYRFDLDPQLWMDLGNWGAQHQVTPFTLLHTAFQIFLARYAGQTGVVTGVPVAGRTRREWEPLVGCFVNTLALRLKFNGEDSFQSIIETAGDHLIDALDHSGVPFDQVVETLGMERDLSRNALFQVMFNYLTQPEPLTPTQQLSLHPVELNHSQAHFDLTFTIAEGKEAAKASFNFNTALFHKETMVRMARHFQHLLAAMIAHPQRPVLACSMLPEEDIQKLASWWNGKVVHHPSHRNLATCFQEQVQRTPSDIALVFKDQSWTYEELNQQVNRLTHYLIKQGVGPETVVGVGLERSPELVTAMLAVWKAGGAYTPLDPQLPQDRLVRLMELPAMRCVVSQSEFQIPSSYRGRHVALDREARSIASNSPENPPCKARPQNLAYVIHTSGSTGHPKPVGVSHHAALDHAQTMIQHYNLKPGERFLQFASLSFDVSMEQFMCVLTSGAALVLRHKLWDPRDFSQALQDMDITVANLPTAYWHLWVSNAVTQPAPSRLRLVIVGGDLMHSQPLTQWTQAFPHIPTLNVYGPTETVVTATTWKSNGPFQPWRKVPIGGPRANRSTHILDPLGAPQPVGVIGELHLGGTPIARGYLNQPALTAAAFVPNPFSEKPGARYYKTGDMVRLTADGNLEFAGRKDAQVKVRGFRIELGDVEMALKNCKGVTEAVVLARPDAVGGKRLDAFAVVDQGGPKTPEILQQLEDRLPHYMIPSNLFILNAMPMTVTGKINHKALPQPELGESGKVDDQPQTQTQREIAAMWEEILDIQKPGISQNFFRLGGHSLLATRLLARLRDRFSVDLSLKALFQNPTIKGLALLMETDEKAEKETLPMNPVPRDQPLFLSPSQKRIWFIEQMAPGGSAYNVPAAWLVDGPLNLDALEQAMAMMVACHESLRTRFKGLENPEMVIDPPGKPAFTVLDYSRKNLDQKNLNRLMEDEAFRPFNLEQGPLYRMTVVVLGPNRFALMLTMHHIITDGWSMGVFNRQLTDCYGELLAGKTPDPRPEPLQYADYAAWKELWLESGTAHEQSHWWTRKLGGETPVMPVEKERPAIPTYQTRFHPFSLDPDLSYRFREFCGQHEISMYMAGLAVWKLFLKIWSGLDDILVGSPVANRRHTQTANMLGCFINTLVMRTDLSGPLDYETLLDRVRTTALDAFAHEDYPFDRLLTRLQPERGLNHNPIFQVFFMFQNMGGQSPGFEGCRMQSVEQDQGSSAFDLNLVMYEGEEEEKQIHCNLIYKPDLFSTDFVEDAARFLQVLLETMIQNPQAATPTTFPRRETEAVVFQQEITGSVPIGSSVSNYRVYFLDRWLNPTPIGIPGELCIGGPSVAAGYLGKPAMTADRFIPHPFCTDIGNRLYRTGDLGCFEANGQIRFLGRLDRQVKVRGYRIELAGVETVLASHPSVLQALVLAANDRLSAYVETRDIDLRPGQLLEYLQTRLPQFMIPSGVVCLPQFPLTPNGKIDLKSLPDPDAGELGTHFTPSTPLERQLVEIWEKVLDVKNIGVRDNFFHLGGHSLMVVRLMAVIKKELGLILPVGVLFQESTVEALAQFIQNQDVVTTEGPLVPLKTSGSQPPLYLVHPVGGDVACYGTLAGHLSPDQPLYGLAAQGLHDESQPLEHVSDMAAAYLAAIRKHQPQGPYYLGGWSLGGVIALEMARRLADAGEPPAQVVLIDTWLPICNRNYQDREVILGFLRDQGRFNEAQLEALFHQIPETGIPDPIAFIEAQLKAANAMKPEFQDGVLPRLYRVFQANLKAVGGHQPKPYRGPTILFRETESHALHPHRERCSDAFGELGMDITVRDIPGNHYTMLAKTENLQKMMEILEETNIANQGSEMETARM